jgi:hypothetical protein
MLPHELHRVAGKQVNSKTICVYRYAVYYTGENG